MHTSSTSAPSRTTSSSATTASTGNASPTPSSTRRESRPDPPTRNCGETTRMGAGSPRFGVFGCGGGSASAVGELVLPALLPVEGAGLELFEGRPDQAVLESPAGG